MQVIDSEPAEGQPAVKALKKHKKKKSLKSESQPEEATEAAVGAANGSLEQPATTKEKKKKKNGAKHVEGEDSKKVKKRKRESLAAEEPEQPAANGTAVVSQDAPEAPTPSAKDAKKKKKKKQRLLEQQENGESVPAQEGAPVAEQQPQSEPAKKKKNKQKKAIDDKENGTSHAQLSPVLADAPAVMQAPKSAPGALESSVVPTDGVAKKDKKKKKKSKKAKGDDEAVCAAEPVVEVLPPPPEVVTPMLANEDITVEPATEEAEAYDEHEDAAGEEWAEEKQLPVDRSFRRVKSEEWLGKKGSMKNSYEATFGSGGWGAKAQQTLGAVRGKGFRHEKTKKKRGSYMGGKIDDNTRASFKYDSD